MPGGREFRQLHSRRIRQLEAADFLGIPVRSVSQLRFFSRGHVIGDLGRSRICDQEQDFAVKRWTQTRSAVFFLLFASCSIGADSCVMAFDEANVPTPAVPARTASTLEGLAASVKQIFRSRCFECHGTTRRESDLNVPDRDSLVGEGRPIYPFNLSDSILYDYIVSEDEDARMPESPRPPLSQQEIETIRKWIEAGAPAFPADVESKVEDVATNTQTDAAGVEYVLSSIAKHLEKTPRNDRRFLRFFSSNHLLVSGVTAAELETQRLALAKAINHLSWQPDLIQPESIDVMSTVFVVDLRDIGWHRSPFTSVDSLPPAPSQASSQQTNTKSATPQNFFDLVLLEYPYGTAFENSEVFDHLQEIYLTPAQMIRPVPFVRVDWFVSTATQSPLYEDLLQLPRELSELETLLGVDSESNLQNSTARRAGMTLSGVSRNNRVVERHPARYGAYWKSFDFQTSKGLQNMFADPINFHFAGGEMIWNLPQRTAGVSCDRYGGQSHFGSSHIDRDGQVCRRQNGS